MGKVATIITSLSEGSSIRDLVDRPGMRYLNLPTGPRGASERWTLFGVGLFAIAREFVEIDPAWIPPGD